jgi:hypothetical protein
MKQSFVIVFVLSIALSLEGQETSGADDPVLTSSILTVLVERVDAINARIDYYHGGGPAPDTQSAYPAALEDALPAWAEILLQAIESINARIDYYHGGGPAPDTQTNYREKLGSDAPAWTATVINTVNSINTSIDYYHGARRANDSRVGSQTTADSVPDWADTVIDDLEAVDTRIKSAGRAGYRRPLPSGL